MAAPRRVAPRRRRRRGKGRSPPWSRVLAGVLEGSGRGGGGELGEEGEIGAEGDGRWVGFVVLTPTWQRRWIPCQSAACLHPESQTLQTGPNFLSNYFL